MNIREITVIPDENLVALHYLKDSDNALIGKHQNTVYEAIYKLRNQMTDAWTRYSTSVELETRKFKVFFYGRNSEND